MISPLCILICHFDDNKRIYYNGYRCKDSLDCLGNPAYDCRTKTKTFAKTISGKKHQNLLEMHKKQN